MIKALQTVVFLLITSLILQGQVPVGFWRDHLSYNSGSRVADGGENIYYAAGVGIVVYKKSDGSLEKLSKVNGLSDVDISSIEWSENMKLLLIGYENGNLDILHGNKVINLTDILRSSVPGSKTINNIMFIGTRAYLSCDFGIVVINLERNETGDTYFLGDGGINLRIEDMAFDGTYLYAATSSGLYKADIDAPNLLDFSFWTRLDFLPGADERFTSVAWFDGKLYAVRMSSSGNYILFQIDQEQWAYFSDPSDRPLRLNVSGNRLTVSGFTGVDIFSPGPVFAGRIDDYGLWTVALRDAVVDDTGYTWIADQVHGLVRNRGENYQLLTPSGPFSNNAFSVTSYPGRTYVAAGGYTAASVNLWQNGEFSFFTEGVWGSTLNYGIRDVILVEELPGNPEIQYIATWGYGLVEYRDGEFYGRFDETNSTLQSIIPGGDFTRIGGMAFDDEKNLWITNTGVPNPVSVKKTNGDWVSFPFGGIINHDHVGKIIINKSGQKWVLLPRGGGLFIFDNYGVTDPSSVTHTRKLGITDENRNIISNEVFSIAEDQNGFIWVGTNLGVVVYYNPSRVFTDQDFHARRIVVSGSRDEELGYLLNNETVTSIAVDGADRKWFGTQRSGVFLVSADGKKQIHHFTRQNSPLLSNNITDISIDPASGEVFFATDRGLISFRSDATGPSERFSSVYVFPNPVRQNYEGPVTITGLIKGSNVKITDISGNLVFETVSLGGQALWDGTNARGQRVRTGIYLIFISTEDGTETHVSKLMFIH